MNTVLYTQKKQPYVILKNFETIGTPYTDLERLRGLRTHSIILNNLTVYGPLLVIYTILYKQDHFLRMFTFFGLV